MLGFWFSSSFVSSVSSVLRIPVFDAGYEKQTR